MGHSSIRIKVCRRKVANLAAYSKKRTVNNCTIPKTDDKSILEIEYPWGVVEVTERSQNCWKNPKEGYPQSSRLRKAYKKKYCNKDGTIRKIVQHASDYGEFPDHTFRTKGRAWFMEQVVQHRINKWEKKNPCPVNDSKSSPDMFEEEFVVPWKAERELAVERIRDAVVSIYDKLPLTGRFKASSTEEKYVEEPVAEIKDKTGEGHSVNNLDNKSKLIQKAKKITNRVHAKNKNLVCTNLKDHKRKHGRIILPDVA